MQNIFIGRQAIFDRKMATYAYELLYRENDSGSVNVTDGEMASSRVMLNAFMEIGLENIVGPHLAFINLTRSFFTDEPHIPFEKDQIVLEILEDIEVDQQLVDIVAKLAADGYCIALDDYEFEPHWDPLLPYVSIIKVEVPAVDPQRVEELVRQLRKHNVKLLAEKIETQEEHQLYLDLGFDYFQGYYFSRPQVIKGKRLEENQLIILQLLASLNDPKITVDKLERLIAQDAALSYKILRHINSAAVALPRKLDRIGEAVVYLGLQQLRTWANLIVLSQVGDKPQELLYSALVRACMCEQLIQRSHRGDAQAAYSAGLLSTLDLLLSSPMEEIMQELPVSDEIKDAILTHEGPMGEAISCVLAYESQQWEKIKFTGLDSAVISEIFVTSSHQSFISSTLVS